MYSALLSLYIQNRKRIGRSQESSRNGKKKPSGHDGNVSTDEVSHRKRGERYVTEEQGGNVEHGRQSRSRRINDIFEVCKHHNGRCGWIPERQQERVVEINKMVTNWPETLKDIPVPTDTEITGYLYDEERKLREFEKDKGLPHMTIQKQQLIVAGLRLLKKIVENQEG